jgi:signal peptidase I
MYPTFPKGEGKTPQELSQEIVATPGMLRYPNGLVLFGKNFFGHRIARGDIVSFTNDKVKEITTQTYGSPSSLVKRVIALSNEKIEIRDGNVLVNGSPLTEPYIARARSTFGGRYLSDCQEIIVPPGSVFVLGDNRKASSDSRHEVGFIPIGDIHHVIPVENQKGVLDSNWRDTANDLSESSKIKLDKNQYLKLLNQKRLEKNFSSLSYETRLENSAEKRGLSMLKYNDFSIEATISGLTADKAMRQSNYSNIVTGESFVVGFYEAGELIENLFEFPDSSEFLLNPDLDEFGIDEIEGTVNGCPTQVSTLADLSLLTTPNLQ